jgi:carbamoyltransferase
MGDGGLALGAAMAVNYKLHHISQITMPDLFLGHTYSDDQIEATLQSAGLRFLKSADIAKEAARCIADGAIVMWYQGCMEAGPRALGARSILARPDSLTIKDTLNLRLKKRVWYQPFCPTMLAEDAHAILADYDGIPNPFMTMAYMVRKEQRKRMCGVINVDGSCRPQIVGDENTPFRNLLKAVKTLTGRGIVLNTSLNIHGEPLVCSPADAVQTLSDAGADYLAIGSFMVKR